MQVKVDINNYGEYSEFFTIKATSQDLRQWLETDIECPVFEQFDIAHVGVLKSTKGLEVSREMQDGSFFMACMKGSGSVYNNGGWMKLSEGEACLLPPNVKNAFKSYPNTEWHVGWGRDNEPKNKPPITPLHAPSKASFPHLAISSAIYGLYAECQTEKLPSSLSQWTDIINHYVMRFATEYDHDPRLWKLWKLVEQDLSQDWSLNEMATTACMSAEHLRRLCKKQIGRTPANHLTFLRMQKARHLLATTDDKVEAIAYQVGYENSFSFSNTFKKWIGWRPSEMRGSK